MSTQEKTTWRTALDGEFKKDYFKNLQVKIAEEYQVYDVYPPKNQISNALNHTQPDDIKVVILGQDPYHGPGQANGMAFSVNKNITIPPSLVNIFTEIKAEYPNDFTYPSHGDLTHWADQGVLLLNAILTVRAGKPTSHKNYGWETYTDAIISYINTIDRPIVFMLWGNFAKSKKELLNNPKHLILETSHPSPFSVNYGFKGCGHFKACNDFLVANNIAPIDWNV